MNLHRTIRLLILFLFALAGCSSVTVSAEEPSQPVLFVPLPVQAKSGERVILFCNSPVSPPKYTLRVRDNGSESAMLTIIYGTREAGVVVQDESTLADYLGFGPTGAVIRLRAPGTLRVDCSVHGMFNSKIYATSPEGTPYVSPAHFWTTVKSEQIDIQILAP